MTKGKVRDLDASIKSVSNIPAKPVTAWGGIATAVAEFVEKVGLRDWVESSIPIHETSNNAKWVYLKVLAQFLTALVGGTVSRIWPGGAMESRPFGRLLTWSAFP
jgi:hypothetical protein